MGDIGKLDLHVSQLKALLNDSVQHCLAEDHNNGAETQLTSNLGSVLGVSVDNSNWGYWKPLEEDDDDTLKLDTKTWESLDEMVKRIVKEEINKLRERVEPINTLNIEKYHLKHK